MIEATDSSFEQEVVNSDTPVIVDFWAPWCGPCKVMGPMFESLAGDFEGRVKFVKVDVDSCSTLAQKYGIRGIPTLMTFNAGSVVKTLVGSHQKSRIQSLVQELVGTDDVQDAE